MDQSNGVPSWVKVIFNAEFFEPCETHSNVRKNDLNFFCVNCLCAICPHCLQGHQEHQYIQIRKYMYRDVINVHDIKKFFNCTGIQTYQTNKAKVVLIKKRPSSQQQSGTTSYRCISCKRNLQDPTPVYCSLRCKVKYLNGETAEITKEQENEEDTTSSSPSPSPSKNNQGHNSRKRKGIPVRAPLF